MTAELAQLHAAMIVADWRTQCCVVVDAAMIVWGLLQRC
jgi:hypothetical protein